MTISANLHADVATFTEVFDCHFDRFKELVEETLPRQLPHQWAIRDQYHQVGKLVATAILAPAAREPEFFEWIERAQILQEQYRELLA